jgi:hypothetical protein
MSPNLRVLQLEAVESDAMYPRIAIARSPASPHGGSLSVFPPPIQTASHGKPPHLGNRRKQIKTNIIFSSHQSAKRDQTTERQQPTIIPATRVPAFDF